MRNHVALLALLALVACAKARKLPDDSIQPSGGGTIVSPSTTNNKTENKTDDKQMLDVRKYSGKILTINSATDAEIRLSPNNAKVLYDSLKIKKFSNTSNGIITSQTKRGLLVHCEENIHHDKPVKGSLFCRFKINPHKGWLENPNWDGFFADLDPSVKPIQATGFNYEVFAELVTIMIKGRDAEALYNALNLQVTESEEKGAQIFTKGNSPLLSCKNRLTDESDIYTCSFTLRLSDGGIATQEEVNAAAKVIIDQTKPAVPAETAPVPNVEGGSVPEEDNKPKP